MQTLPEAAKSEADENTCQIDFILGTISSELGQSAKRCAEIQWVISELLERAHHPNLSAELHVLQDIDRIQQTLEDISTLLETMAEPMKGVAFARGPLTDSVKLDSLRVRLFRMLPQTGAGQTEQQQHTLEKDEITWF